MSTQQWFWAYVIGNALIAASMCSTALAIAFAAFKREARHPWLTYLSAVFFLLAGIGRALKLINAQPSDLPQIAELVIDVVCGGVAILTTVLIWPVARDSLKRASYKELEERTQQLEVTRKLFEAFMENSPVMAFMKDSQSRLVYVNKVYLETFKLNKKDVIGVVEYPWIPQEMQDRMLSHDQEVLRLMQRHENVDYVTLPSGEIQELLVVKFPIESRDETFIGVIAMNIAHRRQQAEMQARLAAIVEASDDAILGYGLNGIITSWNQGAEVLYGYTDGEIIGQNITTIMPPHKLEENERFLAKLGRGEHVDQFETQCLSKSKNIIDVSLTVSPVKDETGRIIGASCISRDISARKDAERKITELNRELNEHIHELRAANEEITLARDEAMEASRIKSAFVANISHELRTPLSGILGMTELMLFEADMKEQVRVMAVTVYDSAKALLQVVNDILDLSKVEAGKITLDDQLLDLQDLMQQCITLLGPAAANKGIGLTNAVCDELPPELYGDPARLRQIFLNVLGNAVKFTEIGSVSFTVKVRAENPDKCLIRFEVTDTGIGINDAERQLLFEPFVQVDSSSTRKFGGTGLGLTISRRFVELMGGRIDVRSEKGKGSTFWFEIPFDKRPAHEEKISSAADVEPIDPFRKRNAS